MALIEVDWRPPRHQLRQFAGIFLVVFGGLGTLLYFNDKPLLVSQIVWGMSAVVGTVGLIFPSLVRPVYVVMMAAALPIGMVVSTILMIVIYFLIMTPIGLLLRLSGHDSMGRRPAVERESFWIERPRTIAVSRYFKQY